MPTAWEDVSIPEGDRQGFYGHIRVHLYGGRLSQTQVDSIEQIFLEGVRRERSIYELAYVLATAHHETARFEHMEEIGRGRGRPYGKPIHLSSRRTVAYYGRGFVQLTWLTNYYKMGQKLGLDLVHKPDLVKQPDIATLVIWEGMIAGDFTGKKLADYFDGHKHKFVPARQIVNGLDRAEMIAGYAQTFLSALRLVP